MPIKPFSTDLVLTQQKTNIMKLKQLLPVFVLISFTLAINSCKKNDAKDEFELTFELSGDQAIADNLTQDANDVMNEVAVDKNLMGAAKSNGNNESNGTGGTVETTGILTCANVTVTPVSGFPKTIVIDFGPGCSVNGITRRGIINIVLTDSLRRPGSTATMTFNNYFVNDYKKEGTITWTNTSAPGSKSWHRDCVGGKITAPNGNYWLHSGSQDIVQTAGVPTPNNLLDDIFSITGNCSVTNANGINRTTTILTALQKKTICSNIDMGTLKIQGPNHYAIVDFGNGTCDNVATISIDGRPPRTIILR